MKDVKTLLKEAREAIKNKEFQTSLKLSKTILKEDKSNYMALVFLGLSTQEVGPINEAPTSFKKAIECNSENPLAWNGLINCYEKINSEALKKDLIESYISILNIEINDRKIIEYSEKLSNLTQYGDATKIIKVINTCRNKFPERRSDINNIVIQLCEKLREKPSEIQLIHEECLLDSVNNGPCKIEYFSSYITLVYNQKRYEDALKFAEKMHTNFPDDTSSLVWICKFYNQLFVEGNEIVNNCSNICKYCLKLLESDPKNAFALFTNGILLFRENKIVEAKDALVEVTTTRPGLVHAWIFLTKLYITLHLFDEASQSALRADKLLKSFNYSNTILKKLLDKYSLEYLCRSSKIEYWQSALNLYDKIEDENIRKTGLKFIILAEINLERFEDVNSLILDLQKNDIISAKLLTAKLHRKKGDFQKALELLENDNVDISEWWIEIGSLYWDLEQYQKSLIPFLKAAKCDPNNYLTYLALGNYYQKIDDLDKAKRCYEKAFKIHPKSKEIGCELSKVYRQEKNWEASQNILQSLTTGTMDQNHSWAWLNLGLSFLEQGEFTKAIDNLQKAVRIETENPVPCWEALADAYLARGSYTSALKCYQICQELSDNKIYPSLQIANIQKILGEYTQAKTDFENLLLSNGQYVPALKGLAETCICLAKQCFQNQRLGTAREHAQTAINKLGIAVQQRQNFSCLWKLLADVCLFVTKLPEKYSCLFIFNTLLENGPSDEKSMICKNDLVDLAIKFYQKAISLTHDNALLWHDLATCYLHQALNEDDTEKRQLLLNYAVTTVQNCIDLDPDNWQYWNLLGNISMEKEPPNYAVAQHAFIKSVSVDHNCAVAWTNLGTLYLMLDDIKLANKAFAQGQRSDPNYVNSWIGQAMIAEIMGHEEAMDLFRHSTQLTQHQQGSIGYGYWVSKTLLDNPPNANIYCIHNMHAVPIACDVLTWYTEKNPQDACAWNMLGILRERMGLKESTLQAFKNAYQLSPKEYRDLARINYGRILSKLGKYTQAINIFQEVVAATFNSGSGLALALFNDKQYEGSYSAYEQALHWLTEEQSSQSDLLVALASMAYMFQGADTAKTLLFQSIQLKPASPWGLYATLSLALLHQDMTLAQLILNEMNTLKDDQQCLAHYAILLSYVYSLQEQYDQAIVEISKLIHRHPNNASVWLTLCHMLLTAKHKRKPSLAPPKCAQTAMKLGRSTMDVTKVLSFASLAFMSAGEQKQAVITAQKAVHSYPNLTTGWAVLSWALTSNKTSTYSKDLLKNINYHIESLNPTESLLKWTRKCSQFIK